MNNGYVKSGFRPPRRYEDPIRAGLVCNEQIRHQEVRLLDIDGNPLGITDARQALKIARDQGFDLVEITAEANPPVVRIVDINKYVYNLKRAKKEQDKKARENAIVVKEIQLRPVIDKHDLEIKVNQARKFLEDDIKIRVIIKFKGRELNFTDKGFAVMDSFLTGIGECKIEKSPTLDSRTILAIVAPILKNK